MKYLLAIAVFLAVLQPMPLQACDMDAAPDMTHHAESPGSGHDCCESEPDNPAHACMDAASCGGCSLSLTVMPMHTTQALHAPLQRLRALAASGLSDPHSHPPFRPPIA